MAFQHNTDPGKPVLVLLRHDLRLSDNKALWNASKTGKPVLPVFILELAGPRHRDLGGARKWWTHHSLEKLTSSLKAMGIRLILRSGNQHDVVMSLLEETGADLVLWNRRYDPAGIEADTELKSALKSQNIECASFSGHLLHEPWQLQTTSGYYYRVFSPFWRALDQQLEAVAPLPAPDLIRPFTGNVSSEKLSDWKLLPFKPDWSTGLQANWVPGEAQALKTLEEFLDTGIRGYSHYRNRPDRQGTSRLSPYLAHGEITPNQIFHAITKRRDIDGTAKDIAVFRKEVGWREFSYHLLFHNPELATENFNSGFDSFPWEDDPDGLQRWQKGMTGYPLVDAGMRELWRTGWMHNRVRMTAASFLIKHLRIDWRVGEQWFWDTLVDADWANNAASWQWVAGSGADAAPYFRIFNPTLQGEKFDPDADYVKRYVPELESFAAKAIYHAKKRDLEAISQDSTEKIYPEPMVDHAQARDQALSAYKMTRGKE